MYEHMNTRLYDVRNTGRVNPRDIPEIYLRYVCDISDETKKPLVCMAHKVYGMS